MDVVTVVVVVCCLGIGMGLGYWRLRGGGFGRHMTQRVLDLSGRAFLFLQQDGRGVGVSQLSRLVVVDIDGNVVRKAGVKGPALLAGVVGTMVWIQEADGISCFALPQLARVKSFAQVLSTHPILGRGYTLVGLCARSGVALRGRDDQTYVLHATGRVEPMEAEFKGLPPFQQNSRITSVGTSDVRPLPSVSGGDGVQAYRDVAEGNSAPEALRLAELPFLECLVAMNWERDEPITFQRPASYLLVSKDIRGPQGQAVLSRVRPDGEVLWTHVVPVILGREVGPGAPVCRVLRCDNIGGSLRILVEADTYRQNVDGVSQLKSLHLLAFLDPSTGKVKNQIQLAL